MIPPTKEIRYDCRKFNDLPGKWQEFLDLKRLFFMWVKGVKAGMLAQFLWGEQ